MYTPAYFHTSHILKYKLGQAQTTRHVYTETGKPYKYRGSLDTGMNFTKNMGSSDDEEESQPALLPIPAHSSPEVSMSTCGYYWSGEHMQKQRLSSQRTQAALLDIFRST